MTDKQITEKECFAQIGLVFYSHLEDMASGCSNWDQCDAHDKARASALYRVAFLEGFSNGDVEDSIRDEFYRAVREHRQGIAELTQQHET